MLKRIAAELLTTARKPKAAAAVRSAAVEALETRQLMSVNVLSWNPNNGVNASETTLSPSNVNTNSFGKLFTTPLDGYSYAQPLIVSSESITAGVNTVTTAPGTYTVVYDETENDSIYAIDSLTGNILWKRSFLTTTADAGNAPGVNVNNPQSASAVTAPTSAQVDSTDITPSYGITGTPVIDQTNNCMYVDVFTQETINGINNYVQRLHAINLSDGTDVVTPYQLGDTTGFNTNTTNIYVYGNGDGRVTDPYNNTGKDVVQFNALRENQRSGLSLQNGSVYVTFASHSDDSPYHGWILSWDVSHLTTKGFVLNGVFNTSPNGGGAGIWGAGGVLAFDPDEPGVFYFETGNGFGDDSGLTIGSNGFPTGGSFYEAAVKIKIDPTTTASNPTTNGWGFKALDYFIPYNQGPLDAADQDLGSGSPIILPDSAAVAGHAHLMLVAGKQGVIYVIDRDDMGEYNGDNDDTLNAVPNGNGNDTPPVQVSGVLSTPAYFNNTIYIVSGYSGPAYSFTLSSTGSLVAQSQTAVGSFGYLPGSPVISSDGTSDGIVWEINKSYNDLFAYDASSYATVLWSSAQAPNSADAVGSVVKFATPVVANGEVFVGASNSLVVYGLKPPVNAVPLAPVLSSTALSSSSINLTWTDPTVAPNTATNYSVEELIKGVWTVVTTAPGGSTSVSIGGLTATTSYSFRIRGLNGNGYSVYSNTTAAVTSNTVASIDFSSGFNGSSAALKFNGSALVSGNIAQLTPNLANQIGSVFSASAVDVTKFSTSFNFEETAGNSTADGFTFTIQNNSPATTGVGGSGLGYKGIAKSVGIKFDLYSNSGEGADSTGLYTNGATPTTPSVDMTSSGVNLHSGDIINVALSYDGTTLTETVADTVTAAVFTHQYTVNIPSITGTTAYVGFTAATGGKASAQSIVNWSFSPNAAQAPNAPTALGVTITSATSTSISWTNNATNQTGFLLDRATDPAFTENLVTQTLPSTPNSFADTYVGLASGGTYYYRIRAVNTAGSSANSNVATISIPYSPAKASDFEVLSVTSTSISMQWIDNAGVTATGYHILRSVNDGTYSLYATLPALTAQDPPQYDWTDTGLTPGSYYDYHVQAFNVAGYNDFVGGNAFTLTAAPSAVTANASAGAISLSWNAPAGAVSYNIYRGTTSGGESATALAAGVTATTYTDTTAVTGATYYYEVTAVNGNAASVGNESAPSAEVSAAALSTAVVKLTGTPIGTAGSYQNDGNTIAKAFDGSLTTFFDPPGNSLKDWVGLDLGSAQVVTQIKYAPRSGFANRMINGQFQASSSATFSSNVVTLATIAHTPVVGSFTTIAVNPSSAAFEYIRYVGGTSWVNIAEFEVDGPQSTSTSPKLVQLKGAAIGTSGSYENDGNTIAKAFDGSLTTFFDAPTSNLTDWVGLDLGSAQTIAQIKFAPRSGYASRMVGGVFQVSTTADFSGNVQTLYTIISAPAAGQLTTISVNPGTAFRYVRYVGGTGWVNIAEMQVFAMGT